MVGWRERAIVRLRWLWDQTPPLPVPGPQSWLRQLAAEQRQVAEDVIREEFLTLTEDRIGHEVITGLERVELAVWVTRVTKWWTPQETLAALDDLAAGLSLDEVLRICRSEGFATVAETERDGDRFVWLLDDEGLLGLVYLSRDRTGPPQPWSLTIYGNRVVEDPGLWSWIDSHMHNYEVLSDGRWIVGGDLSWHLRYTCGSGSLRVALALLRATTSPITPWQYPAITGWTGPDTPHGMLDDAPADEIARTARTHTRDALAALPEHVRATLGTHPIAG